MNHTELVERLSAPRACDRLEALRALKELHDGGVLPMPRLPRGLRAVGEFLPVGHLRTLMYLPISRWGEVPLHLLGAAVWILCLVAIGVALYSRRLGREEL